MSLLDISEYTDASEDLDVTNEEFSELMQQLEHLLEDDDDDEEDAEVIAAIDSALARGGFFMYGPETVQ